MRKVFYLTNDLRNKLKKPFGRLIKNKDMKSLARKINSKKLISVGDVTSKKLKKLGIVPSMTIIDNKVARKRIKSISFPAKIVYRIKNPAGTLTKESWDVISEAMMHNSTKIVVDGEEDLMVIPVVHVAPIGSIVLYGQPKQGIVVIRVTKSKKKKISTFFHKKTD